MAGLLAFTVKRIFSAIIVVWLIATLVFVLSRASPEDPITALLGQRAGNQKAVASMRHAFGLDKPLYRQYTDTIGGYLHGDLGLTEETGNFQQPVSDVLRVGLPVSLKLGGLALLVALLMGLPVGLLSALKQNSWIDHVSQSIMIVLYALPAFVVAPVAQLVIGAQLHWLPVSGWGDPGWLGIKEMVMPVLIFATQIAGYFSKSFRSFMLEVLKQDYIRTARAKGLKERTVIYLHAFKNTLLPLASIVGPTIAFLVVGAFIIEFYFSIPGVGYITVNSVVANDYPVIEATTILIATAVVVVNALTDIFYAMIDPRVRL